MPNLLAQRDGADRSTSLSRGIGAWAAAAMADLAATAVEAAIAARLADSSAPAGL